MNDEYMKELIKTFIGHSDIPIVGVSPDITIDVSKRNEWIDADKRKPPIGLRVLVCDAHGWVWTAIYEWYDPGYRWEYTAGDEPGCEITYWMPLPKAPPQKE